MTPNEVTDILRKFARACRADECLWGTSLPGVPTEVGAAVESAIEMIDRLEAAEKERDALRAKSDTRKALINLLRAEIDALRAEIEAMEKQEPVGKFIQHPSNGLWEQDGYGDNPEASPLYALPGAQTQPAPSVPVAALRPVIDWLRNGCDQARAADELEMLASAPEAKP